MAALAAGLCYAHRLPAQQVRAQQAASAAPGQTNAVPEDPELGLITGSVTARDGSALQGAHLTLTGAPGTIARTAVSDEHGVFRFDGVQPGPFALVASVEGFSDVRVSGILTPGAQVTAPPMALPMATAVSEVQVTVNEREMALEEVREEETQRVLGVIPNFLVSYDWKPAPLSSRQKFELAWRSATDPVSILVTGAVSGVQQANNDFPGYGQGAAGYGKRFGANYADLWIGTMLGSAALPALLHQDPRYLYKGAGSVTGRALYAISATVICRGDNGHWEPNYSNVLGSLGAGAISNLYYPASDRNGVSLTIENGIIGVATGAIGNLFQEFLVRRLTPHPPPAGSAVPTRP